jgi:hypothetical protein
MESTTCDKCHKKFSTKYNLVRHQFHSKKPCIPDYTEPAEITIHPHMSSDQTEFRCQYCNKIFKRRNNYYHHVKNTCNFTTGTVRKAFAVKQMRIDKRKKQKEKELALVPAAPPVPVVQNYTVNDYKTIQYITNNITMVGKIEIKQEELPTLAPTLQNLKHIQSKFPAIQNPIGFEDISHITDEMTGEIFKDEPSYAFEKIIKLVNDMPGNQNVGYYDKENLKLMFIHKDGLLLKKHDDDRNIGFICSNIIRIYSILLNKIRGKMPVRLYKRHYEFSHNSDDDAEKEMESIYRHYLLEKGFANFNILEVHETIIKNLQAIIKQNKKVLLKDDIIPVEEVANPLPSV